MPVRFGFRDGQVVAVGKSSTLSIFDVVKTTGCDDGIVPWATVRLLRSSAGGDVALNGRNILSRKDQKSGLVSFIPASSKVTVESVKPYSSTIICVDRQLFKRVAHDAIDMARSDLGARTFLAGSLQPLIITIRHMAASSTYAGNKMLFDHLGMSLAASVLMDLGDATVVRQFGDGPGMLDLKRSRRVLEFIEDNIGKPIDLEDIARVAGLSLFHFCRAFHKTFGRSPARYVAKQRITRAKYLLTENRLPLSQIALECGYSSQSHMTTAFKKIVGLTPGEYRRAVIFALTGLLMPLSELLEPLAGMF